MGARGAEALRRLAEYARSVVVEVEMKSPDGDSEIVEVELRVPSGEEAEELQEAAMDFGDGGVSNEDSLAFAYGWGERLMERHGVLETPDVQRILRTIGAAPLIPALLDCAGLRARANDLSPDRS